MNFTDWLLSEEQGLTAQQNGPQMLKAYHGSIKNFNKFDMGQVGATNDFGTIGLGLYFSTDADMSAGYAEMGQRRNPGNSKYLYVVQLSFKNPYLTKDRMIRRFFSGSGEEQSRSMTQWMQSNGHDGIIMQGGDEIIVFDPSIIQITKKKQINTPVGYNGGLDVKTLSDVSQDVPVPSPQASQTVN